MTTVYFIRHAEPNYANHNDQQRELSQKGWQDRKRVSEFLADKHIDVALSSPYKRAVDTIKDFADQHDLTIKIVADFRERKVDNGWIEDFNAFSRKQWEDFTYKLKDGESLKEVQERNIKALTMVLESYPDQNIVIGSHGTALSTVIHYYDPSFGYKEFEKIQSLMPWIVQLTFDGTKLLDIKRIDVFCG
ncbi:histidine phosphatase family protein [Beduini massiliensis]|uniref:histidine phosphatase family protein n=1 Tax=Beduini massiliensis TaxID=1585974 RepID=UPI00059A9A15|nr:histidine phosphatase family protein [Beduini massiliensis]